MPDTTTPHDPLASANPLLRGYDRFSTATTYLQSFALLVLRLGFGWKTYLSGYRHLHHVDTMVEQFVGWDIPYPRFNVYVSGLTEVVGGLLLMAGLATRLISIPLVFNFLVAILTAGKMRVKQAIFGGELLDTDSYDAGRLGGLEAIIDDSAFPFMIAALVTLAFGAGKVSIDYLVDRLVHKRRHDPLSPVLGGEG